MYNVSFYISKENVSPIKDYFNSMEESARAKVLTKINYLKIFGLTREVPDLKKVTNTPLWEVRILGKDNIRILCMSLPNKEVKILHVFAKKKQKTPTKEVRIALNRYREVLSRNP